MATPTYPGNLPLRYTATGDGGIANGDFLTGFTMPGSHGSYAYANCGTWGCNQSDHPKGNGTESW